MVVLNKAREHEVMGHLTRTLNSIISLHFFLFAFYLFFCFNQKLCFMQYILLLIFSVYILLCWWQWSGVGISCCCRQFADGLAHYIYPHKFCIAHTQAELRLLLYMALISSNIQGVHDELRSKIIMLLVSAGKFASNLY